MTNVHFDIPNFVEMRQRLPLPPIELLREAAREFGQHTGHKVEGMVFTANPGGSDLFRHTFYLRVPALNEYTYPLFYVTHNVGLYPADIFAAGGNKKSAIRCRNDEALLTEMNRLFGSLITVQLVNALLAQIDDDDSRE